MTDHASEWYLHVLIKKSDAEDITMHVGLRRHLVTKSERFTSEIQENLEKMFP